jgi:hypothetical protein
MIKAGEFYDFDAIGQRFGQSRGWAFGFYRLATSRGWIRTQDWWNGLPWWREKEERSRQRAQKIAARKQQRIAAAARHQERQERAAWRKLEKLFLRKILEFGYTAAEAKQILPQVIRFNIDGQEATKTSEVEKDQS